MSPSEETQMRIDQALDELRDAKACAHRGMHFLAKVKGRLAKNQIDEAIEILNDAAYHIETANLLHDSLANDRYQEHSNAS